MATAPFEPLQPILALPPWQRCARTERVALYPGRTVSGLPPPLREEVCVQTFTPTNGASGEEKLRGGAGGEKTEHTSRRVVFFRRLEHTHTH